MNLFSLSWSLGVLTLVFASVENSSGNNINNELNMNHIVYVSSRTGKDGPECLQNRRIACEHLYYVFDRVREQNSTVVYVEFGDYYLNKSYVWWHINNFSLIGLPSPITPSVVAIHCKENAGLSFIFSSGIVMKSISLSSCGAIQNSTSKGHRTFLAALFLANCINFSMDSVEVIQSPGIGIQLYDVAGVVTVFNSHFFGNGKRDVETLEKSIPGGGFYFEFTYMGGLYPFKARPKPIYQENGMFHFFNVTFENNSAPPVYDNNTVNPEGDEHIAFGRGGGASLFIKGFAKNNVFSFEKCYFTFNYAVWGAGLFAEFQDSTSNNSIKFQLCHFNDNNVTYGGGGVRAGLINKHQDQNFIPNWIRFTLCDFKRNQAILGGGISLYGTTKKSYLLAPYQSFVNFTKCVIEENRATVGSAFCSALGNTNEYAVGGSSESFKILFESTKIKSNKFIYTEDKKVSGTGAFYAHGTPVLLKNTDFISNKRTAFVLDNALVEVHGNISFVNNTGQKGGAMALYGESKIKLANKANLTFVGNKCSVQGGAIYVRVPGPQMVAFNTTELQIHDCFFPIPVGNCNYTVSFYGNKGPSSTSGYSVYATTLQFCRLSNEPRMNNKALQWQNCFYYYYINGTKSDRAYEIVTDAVKMEIDRSDWNTATDKSFSPVVKLFDEKNNSVYGVIKIEIKPKGKVHIDPPSTYFLAKDNIESLQIKAQPESRYNISLLTVDSQLVSQPVINAEVKGCEPGFLWENYACKCDESQIGVSRCDKNNQTLFLLKGYWGGHVHAPPRRKFVVVPCPENYCRCNQNALTSSGECLFNKDEQCSGNRHSQLCGKCKTGFSLEIGGDECKSNCNSRSRKWIGYLMAILVGLSVLVLVIMWINFDPFSAYLNAWLYSYQVLSILVPRSYVSFDPFLTFIIGLAHIQVDYVSGMCMWPNIDDLQKLALNYLLPVYFFICLCVLNKVAVTWPNSFLTRRFTQTSFARAFCTLLVLSYSTVVNVSLQILYPLKIGDEYFVFYQGNVKYFSSYHIGFFIGALILLIFVGILFPMVLLRRQWFNFIDNGLKKLLLDNFQRCFRDGYKWCAGYYFVCRFIFLVVRLAVRHGALQASLFNGACSVILTVFVLCQPYSENGGTIIPYKILNISDAVLLCNLCLISSFGGAASGVYATREYYEGFKTVISILSYIPLVFSFGLLAYVLRHRCNGHHLLREVE